MKKLLVIALAAASLVGCKKEEGEGGRAALYGKVMTEGRLILNNPTIVLYSAPAFDQEIYITYGDNIGPDDRVRTNFDGEYEFPYLRPGNYTVWTYSRDTTDQAVAGQAPENMAVIRQVEITDKKERVEVPTMTVYVKP